MECLEQSEPKSVHITYNRQRTLYAPFIPKRNFVSDMLQEGSRQGATNRRDLCNKIFFLQMVQISYIFLQQRDNRVVATLLM